MSEMRQDGIRDAQPQDVPVLCRLLDQLGYPLPEEVVRRRCEQVLATAGHRILVAQLDGRVVGMLHVFERPALEKPPEAVVQSLVIDSDHRGKGIGAVLMRAAEAWAQGRGLASTALYTRVDRSASRAFYERLGYRLKATSHLMVRD
jgi:GNAT superfamily N-acetyltransferase